MWVSSVQPAPPHPATVCGVHRRLSIRAGLVDVRPRPDLAAQVENSQQRLKTAHHIVAPSAETISAFNMGFDAVNVHHPTSISSFTTRKL
jgi:hypothetical protein